MRNLLLEDLAWRYTDEALHFVCWCVGLAFVALSVASLRGHW